MNPLKRIWNRLTKNRPAQSRRFFPTLKGGVYIDHDTALNFSAVFACVRWTAETVAGLPWHVFRKKPGGGSEAATTHSLDMRLHLRPNPEMSAFSFKTTLMAWAQTWGNAYAEIEKDGSGRVAALWPISPDRVEPKRDESGQLYYEILNQRGDKTNLRPDQVFHLAGMGFDGIMGYSIVSLAATSIGAGIASDEFVANFYSNGAVMSGALTHPKQLNDEGFDRLKKDFKDQYTGAKKAWKPIILEDGVKWETFGMPLKDAEFLASQKFRVNDIARWFRVPPHKIGDLERATFSNIEHQSIEVVQDSITPWTLRNEQEADYKLISPRSYGVYYTKMNLNSLLRGDHETRAKFYKAMKEGGNLNSNEIRNLEDMNPIGKKGDKYTMQAQYTTLERIGEDPPNQRRHTDNETDIEADTEKIKDLYGEIIDATTIKILRREVDRFNTIINKDKPAAYFNEWVDKFFMEHTQYMQRTLGPVVRCITEYFKIGQSDEIVDAYTHQHIEERKEFMIEVHAGGDPALDENRKAAAMAEILIYQILIFSNKG